TPSRAPYASFDLGFVTPLRWPPRLSPSGNPLNRRVFSRFSLPTLGIRWDRVPGLPASQVGRPVCALLVERDAGTRDMYVGFLRQCGFDVEEAQDGPEGLAKAFSCHPHVIITSTRLSGMSGFDLCRLLRADHLTSSIPILVVTSETGADGRRALSAGA